MSWDYGSSSKFQSPHFVLGQLMIFTFRTNYMKQAIVWLQGFTLVQHKQNFTKTETVNQPTMS